MTTAPQISAATAVGNGVYSYRNLSIDVSRVGDAATQARIVEAFEIGAETAKEGGTSFQNLIAGLTANGPRTITFYDSAQQFGNAMCDSRQVFEALLEANAPGGPRPPARSIAAQDCAMEAT